MLNPVNMAHSSFSLISHLTLMTMPYLKLSLFLLPVIPPSCGVHLLPLDPLLFTSFLGLYPLLCNGHWWLVHTQAPLPLRLRRIDPFSCGEPSFHLSWFKGHQSHPQDKRKLMTYAWPIYYGSRNV